MKKTITRGDMMEVFSKVDHFIVVTGSNLRTADKALVMLEGMAGRLAKLHPTLPAAMGKWINDNHRDCGIFWLRCAGKVGLFQSMIMPRNGCDLGLVSKACHMLKDLALANPDKSYALEHPSIKDPEFMTQGLIDMLPDNVSVWKPA